MASKRILHLSLKKPPFEVMVTGEKDEEFRKNSEWIRSRLFDKKGKAREYDVIKFTNGYGDHRPWFICEYKGFVELYAGNCPSSGVERRYSNGFILEDIGIGDYVILCGKIIECKNC